ncbi:MAG: protein-disulfide reductase DsbD [Alloalcanivorax venustensis]
MTGFFRGPALRLLMLTAGLILATTASALSLGGGNEPFGGGQDRLPNVDEAIQVVPDADWDRQQLLVSFSLLDRVYLYRHRLDFTLRDANGNLLDDFDDLELPPGEAKTDEIYGDVNVYFGQLDVRLPLDSVPLADTELEVHYQGCIEDKLCYPPEVRTFSFSAPGPERAPATGGPAATEVSASDGAPRDDQGGFFSILLSEDANAFNSWMHDRNLGLIVALFFAGGLLLAFTPCVFPMVPILSGIIAGQSDASARRGFILSCAYVLGVAVPYTLAGLLVAVFGAGLNLQFLLQQPAAILTSVVIFVLLALSMFGLYELQLPERLRNRLNNAGPSGRGGLGGAVLLGVISALVVSPCVTPILAGALLYVAGTGDAATGAASLFALALGMGVPLIIFGTGGGHFLPRAGQWMEDIKRFFGVVMLGVAIWLLERIVSDTLTLALYGLLLAVYGVQLGALEPVREGGSRLKRGLALVMALYGAIMVVGAAGGGSDPWQPLKPLTQTPSASSAQAGDNTAATTDDAQHGPWVDVDGRQGLRDALARSADADKPVLVDFFAEWCVACKVMEETTLSDPRVLDAMAGYDLYRVDITEINQENQNIMADYDIFGLPSFVFFAPDGEEVPESRVLGEMDSERFLKHLERRVTPHL